MIMKRVFFIQVLVCAFSCGGALYAYVRQQNDLTKVRIDLPKLTREVRQLEELNSRLRYEIERFENPKHLMELAKRPEFSHLKHPLINEISVVQVHEDVPQTPEDSKVSPATRAIFIGAR